MFEPSALPDAIGELKALTKLDLTGCLLEPQNLPEGIDGREGLTVELPVHLVTGPLQEDFAALLKLRDDESGALKEFLGTARTRASGKSRTGRGMILRQSR